MANRRISVSDIIVGRPLPWDVYGSDGDLLLRKGYVVNDLHQVKLLIERGLFVDSERAGEAAARDNNVVAKVVENPSVVRTLNAVRADLKILLYNLTSETDVPAKIRALARKTYDATCLNTDVALACILLNQDVGYPARHCVDTSVVAMVMARALKKTEDEILVLGAAALSMNASMARQQEKLHMKNLALVDDEKQLIFNHPKETVRQLRVLGVDDEVWLSAILHHHENEDGSGYPDHLKAAEISSLGKILAVADRYCARVCIRGYRKTLLPNAAMRDIMIASKSTIDPGLAAALIHTLGVYPIGTFVKLADGEIAVVTGLGETATTPMVHALIGPRGTAHNVAIKRSTQKPEHAIREVLGREQVPSKFALRQIWGEIASL
jgi:HD-GYP domain-containing protein (c-di-GMP phosphodiesterase class II)